MLPCRDGCAYAKVASPLVACRFNWAIDDDERTRIFDRDVPQTATFFFPILFEPRHGPDDCAYHAAEAMDSCVVSQGDVDEFLTRLRKISAAERAKKQMARDETKVDV